MNPPPEASVLPRRRPRRLLDAVAGPNHGVRLPVRVGPFRIETEVTLGGKWILADGTVWRTIAITALDDTGAASRRLPRSTAEVGFDPSSGALRYAGCQVEGGRLGAQRVAGLLADRIGRQLEAAARDAAPRTAVDEGARLSARTARTGRRVGAAAGGSRPAAPTRRTERTCVSKA